MDPWDIIGWTIIGLLGAAVVGVIGLRLIGWSLLLIAHQKTKDTPFRVGQTWTDYRRQHDLYIKALVNHEHKGDRLTISTSDPLLTVKPFMSAMWSTPADEFRGRIYSDRMVLTRDVRTGDE